MQYTYICKDCDKRFNIFASIGTVRQSEINCPDCKSFDIVRQFFPVHVSYHGEGFTKKVEEEK